MKQNKINFNRARATKDGIKIFVNSLDNHNQSTDKLREDKRERYSYQLPHERKHHVVFHGLCENSDPRKIMEELRKMKLEADNIQKNQCSVTTLPGQNGEPNDLQG